MLKIIICDDLMQDAASLAEDIRGLYGNKVYTTCCHNASDLIKKCEEERYDLCFVDIRLPDMTGIEAAKRLRLNCRELPIVFITNYVNEYADDIMIDITPFGFISKPLNKKRVTYYIDRVIDAAAEKERSFIFVSGNKKQQLAQSAIMYIESKGRSKEIHTDDKIFSFIENMNNVERALDDRFIRCHNSFLVNIQYISSVDNHFITLKNSEKIAVSRNRAKESKVKYFDYVRRHFV